MATKKKVPWKKANPVKRTSRTTLTPAQKKEAKARASAAGRPYPNLVDNMAVAGKAAKKKTTAGTKRAPAKTAKQAKQAKNTAASSGAASRKASTPAKRAPAARKVGAKTPATKKPARKAAGKAAKKPAARKARKNTR